MKFTKQIILEAITTFCALAGIFLIGLALDAVLNKFGIYAWIGYWLNHFWGIG